MKNFLIYLGGLVSGVILTIVAAVLISNKTTVSNEQITISNMPGVVLFEQPGECLTKSRLKVMQTLAPGMALALEQEYKYDDYRSTDLLVLLVNNEEEYYYDDQVIKMPKGKCLRQIGVYTYETRQEIEKTVPVAMIMDEKTE